MILFCFYCKQNPSSFIPIRKAGKLPGEKIKFCYDLEYGSSTVEIHQKDIKQDWNI